MPQNQQRRSEMWWRGHNDALAGDPPNESYYHYYYEYKLAYDQVRRDQRRSHRQRVLSAFGRRLLIIGPALLLLGGLGYGAWQVYGPQAAQEQEVVVASTPTPRPTPRPTLPPPTPTPEPTLRPDSFAVITGTEGAPLRARTEPGVNSGIKARFPEGQNVHVLDGPRSADGRDWWLVEADGAQGWAAADFLKPIEAPPQ
jgi:hypothetical protein